MSLEHLIRVCSECVLKFCMHITSQDFGPIRKRTFIQPKLQGGVDAQRDCTHTDTCVSAYCSRLIVVDSCKKKTEEFGVLPRFVVSVMSYVFWQLLAVFWDETKWIISKHGPLTVRLRRKPLKDRDAMLRMLKNLMFFPTPTLTFCTFLLSPQALLSNKYLFGHLADDRRGLNLTVKTGGNDYALPSPLILFFLLPHLSRGSVVAYWRIHPLYWCKLIQSGNSFECQTLFSFTPPFFLPLCYWLWQEGQDETWGSHCHCCGCWYILTHTHQYNVGRSVICCVLCSTLLHRARWKRTFSLPAEANVNISIHIVSEIRSPVRQSPKTEPPRLIQMGHFEPPLLNQWYGKPNVHGQCGGHPHSGPERESLMGRSHVPNSLKPHL